jgi:hypothetical protein
VLRVAKKKNFDGDPGGLIGDAMFSVIKPIYKEGERQKRAAKRPRRTYYAPEPKISQKDIVFQVLPRAIRNAGANFSARDLYYATRPLVYKHSDWDDGKELQYSYFSQTILTEYQERHGLIPGLWRDPRGSLHEPHTGRSIGLGTIEVANYEFPEYTFDKILYVEKEGEWPKLQAARLAERYDMAIASAKGYPVEAVRELFARAEGGDYQLFVFHDADIDGYNIAHVMREATRRMPHHNVDVVDIGLTVADAVDLGLDSEPFNRKKDMPWRTRRRLTQLEREYFIDLQERFELNAILPDTRRIEYIEEQLKKNGVRGKVVPPEEELPKLAEEMYRHEHGRWVEEALHDLVSLEEVKNDLADEFMEEFELENARRLIEEGFEEDRTLSWRSAFEKKLRVAQKKYTEALKEAMRKRAIEALAKE